MSSDPRGEALVRLGAPSCDYCGAFGASKRKVDIRVDSDHGLCRAWTQIDSEMRFCKGCVPSVIGQTVYAAFGGVTTGVLDVGSSHGERAKPLGIVLRVHPLPSEINARSIGIEMRRK